METEAIFKRSSMDRLDSISKLQGHRANKISVELLATFLPEEVIEGLYSAVEGAGLTVENLTLEPIAAINVAIPEKFRLLNIALVDVGVFLIDVRAGLLLSTFVLSFLMGCFSRNKLKFTYPIVPALLFVVTIPIYYNASALIHAVWYLVLSALGVLIGSLMLLLQKRICTL